LSGSVSSPWRYAAAAVTGGAHRVEGLGCQDRFACSLIPTGIIAAIADGAGSAARGEYGAEIATRAFVNEARAAIAEPVADLEDMVRECAIAARAAIAVEAQAAAVPMRDYSATLLGLVVTDRGGAVVQIGDGAVVYAEASGAWSCAIWPQRGEFHNTTFFLTDDTAEASLETARLPPSVADIAMLTDGLEVLALDYASQSAHAPFFDGFFSVLRASPGGGHLPDVSRKLAQFLESDRVMSRADDDLSLLIATRM
jgi:hypothetical protein